MASATLTNYIDISPDICGGKPRIAGHRITVQNIAIWHERMGKTVDEISADYGLSLAEIYAALSYYFDNRVAIDRDIQQSQGFVDTMRAGSIIIGSKTNA
jgi:uncharacterized protein (DUF433 family)